MESVNLMDSNGVNWALQGADAAAVAAHQRTLAQQGPDPADATAGLPPVY